jgi:hypothetical protein
MVMIEPEFVYGVVRKSLFLGMAVVLGTLLAVSENFAVAVAIGTVLSAINLRVMAWTIKKMLDAGRDGGTSAGAWGVLLTLKMLVLIGIIWWLIAHVNVNAVGFTVGFSLFMPAIGWQMLVAEPPGGSENDSVEGKAG